MKCKDYVSCQVVETTHLRLIDLVTVFDAILTSRQTREKLQCLYENLMSHNFRKTAVLKKNINYKAKDCPKKFGGRTCA